MQMNPANVRLRVDITGVVQGVGFRPAVARIAARHGLGGVVFNDAGAVHCELEGPPGAVAAAVDEIHHCPPPMARIDSVATTTGTPLGQRDFRIVASRPADEGTRTLIPPDIAVCADCLAEMRTPTDRRYGHPFISCTNCGPRYTVITGLPYDRPATTMAAFPMCEACSAEYHDPTDRRYHAQTVACPDCGPTLAWSGPGTGTGPLAAAAAALDDGAVVAIKGIGGYHLACRADLGAPVDRLRRRKDRPAKPFAVMVADLDAARRVAYVGDAAAAQLRSPAAPIVLVPRREHGVRDAVAPGLRSLGLMLAYSPVHHLLFDRLGPVPLVMTSANQGGSPIVFRDTDLDWLDGLADGVLTHDRRIHVPCEDSVVFVADGGTAPIRRSRGYAPLPVRVPGVHTESVVLATGGDLKTTFCLMGPDGRAHMSAHLGDMADPRTQVCFDDARTHLSAMTDRQPAVIAHDMHPTYATTHWARRQHVQTVAVQHHHAHAVALLAEHGKLGTPVLVAAFDGTGYGTDGTIWGGELLTLTDPTEFTRVGHLAPFALPGGDEAARHPARIALDLLHRAGIGWEADLPPVTAVGADGVHVLEQQIPRGLGCMTTTSTGRLFDAVASLLGVCQTVTYEGQAAVELEHLARDARAAHVEFDVRAGVIDPLPAITGLVAGLRAGRAVPELAAGFHAGLISATATAIGQCAATTGIGTVGLTGGVFVNQILLEGLRKTLLHSGFDVLTHAALPCTDGGIALGQAVVAALCRRSAAHPSSEEGRAACASASPAR